MKWHLCKHTQHPKIFFGTGEYFVDYFSMIFEICITPDGGIYFLRVENARDVL